jgi:hypothetical protein
VLTKASYTGKSVANKKLLLLRQWSLANMKETHSRACGIHSRACGTCFRQRFCACVTVCACPVLVLRVLYLVFVFFRVSYVSRKRLRSSPTEIPYTELSPSKQTIRKRPAWTGVWLDTEKESKARRKGALWQWL